MEIQTDHVEIFQRRFSQTDFDRFAALTQDINPIHVDPDFSKRTRFGRTVAHGMLLYSIICASLNKLFPDLGILQLQQELMFPNPTFTDTEISVQLQVTSVQPDEHTYDIRTVIQLPDGNYACEGKTCVCLPGSKNCFSGKIPHMGAGKESTAKTLKNLTIGQSATAKRVFTRDNLIEYADLTGDQNPIATDADYARRLGYKDCIVPGPLLSGIFSDILGTRVPGRGTNWLKQKLYFPAPAYVGEEITAGVEITRLRPQKNLVNLRGTCTNPDGKLVCQAESLVLVKDLEGPV